LDKNAERTPNEQSERTGKQPEPSENVRKIIELIKEGKTITEIINAGLTKSRGYVSDVKRKYCPEYSDPFMKKTPEQKRQERTDRLREKTRKTAIVRQAIAKADLITDEQINNLQIMLYNFSDLIEINNTLKEEVRGIPALLEELIDTLKKKGKSFTDDEKANVLKDIFDAMYKVKSIYINAKVRIDAIDKIRSMLEYYTKAKMEIEFRKETQDGFKHIFHALNVLPENYYHMYKEELLKFEPAMQVLFNKWEDTEEATINPEVVEEAQVITQKED
jgi:hypothetical protein